MKSNKLYAAAMLADEIGILTQKITLARNLMNDIENEKISKLDLNRNTPRNISTYCRSIQRTMLEN